MKKLFAVWREGYLANGMEGIPAPAWKLGEVEAETFAEACALVCSDPRWQKQNGNFNPVRLTVWACRLFDNEGDARRGFG